MREIRELFRIEFNSKVSLAMSVFLLISFFSINLSATTNVVLDENIGKEMFKTVSSDESSTVVEFSLSKYSIDEKVENGKTYKRVFLDGEGEFALEGKPDLSIVTRLIAIPDDKNVSVRIVSLEEEIIDNILVYPRQKLSSESRISSSDEFVIDNKFYSSRTVFPENLVEIGEPAIMRDYRVLNLSFFPFQYNPSSKELKIIKNMQVELTYKNSNGKRTNLKSKSSRRNNKVSRFFDPIYRSVISNYEEITRGRDNDDFQRPTYLFIYPDDSSVLTTLNYLTDWKKEIGFDVKVASTSETGTSLNSIKNYIADAYNTWENPPEFVTLVGDASGSYNIPTSYINGGEGDQPYAMIEGSDILADVIIGRLSFNSISELQTIVSKIFKYEKTPHMTNPAWFKKTVLVGDPGTSGQSCITTNQFIKTVINDNQKDFTHDEIYSSPFVSQMRDGINAGAGYVNYRGYYGMSGWNNSSVYNLNNGQMLPLAVIITCGTGSFANGTSVSEAFLKAGTATSPKGGIAGIATATLSTHTCYNNVVDGGIFTGIFEDEITNPGGALVKGKLELYNSYPQNQANAVYSFSYWNNLMGDPGLRLWTNTPEPITVNYEDEIGLGTNFIEVEVLNEASEPLENTWVTILKGNEEIFDTGFTDEYGMITLDLNAGNLVEGEVKITVTGQNLIPHSDTFTISVNDRLVNSTGYSIDDDNSGSSNGNDDGIVNPGEEIELDIIMKNFGSLTSNNVNVVITSINEFVNITNGSASYGNISSGNTGTPISPFVIEVAENTLGGTDLLFRAEISDGSGNNWLDFITIPVSGANLFYESLSVSDDGSNGILDPSENAEITITIKNYGSLSASNITGILSSPDNSLEIIDANGSFGTINSGATSNNNSDKFSVFAPTLLLPGTHVPLNLTLSNSEGYNNEISFLLEIGTVTVLDPLGVDAGGYSMYDDGDIGYSFCPTYEWIEINPNSGGNGTVLSLYDPGDVADIETVELPFTFKFYGQSYDLITICSDGWVSPGITEQNSFMNWHLPATLGPSPMIAPFWDDLKITGNAKVCYYYDTSINAFIVEWDELKSKYNSAIETFQVILYDPIHYPTLNGNGQIKFQYKEINNTDQGTYGGGHVSHGEYASVGLEDHTGSVGLEYTYANIYPTAAKELSDNMAIFITGATIPANEPYLVKGTVTIDDSDGNNDGLVNPGETIKLQIDLENVGSETATGITSILSSSTNFIDVTNPNSSYNNISGTSFGTNLTDFVFDVSEIPVNGDIASFILNVSSNENSWIINFDLTINSPDVNFNSVLIIDEDNNVLDPGESAIMKVALSNNGGQEVSALYGTLSSSSEYITIESNLDTLETLNSGVVDFLYFNISADEDTPTGHLAGFTLDLINESETYTTAINFNITVALVYESFESGDFNSFAWTMSGDADFSISTESWHEYFSAKSGDINDGESTSLKLEINVLEEGEMSFYKKVSCEENYDNFAFYIDGSYQNRWSGEVAWSEEIYNLTVGNHILEWRYYKDNMQSSGSDAAWVDYIVLPSIGIPSYTEIEVDVDSFDLIVGLGDSLETSFNISNVGDNILNYSVTKEYVLSGTTENGGPDEFGYFWFDSNDPNGPVFNWKEVSSTATQLSFSHNCVGTELMDIGFEFQFYGENYNQFRVNPNGWVGFGNDNEEWQNTRIPSSGAPFPAVLAFWDDLYPQDGNGGGGDVYYEAYDDSLIVWYHNVEHWNTNPGTYDFQIILYSNGDVLYQYNTVSGAIDTQTIGMQNSNGSIATQVVFNDSYVENNLAIKFMRPTDWLSIDNNTGEIPIGGNSEQINLTIRTSELANQDYLCNLKITSNDFNNSEIIIPVNLSVGPVSSNDENLLIYDWDLSQNYPNPFNPVTKIDFIVKSGNQDKVNLVVYNVLGETIWEMGSRKLTQGSHTVRFNGNNLNSGVYFYSLIVDGKRQFVKKMVMTK